MKAASRSRTEWVRLVTELGKSGAHAVEFAAQHGVNASTLVWWRSFLRRQAASVSRGKSRRSQLPRAGRDVRLLRVVATPPNDASVAAADSVVEVTVAIGRACVSVRRGVDAATLATVLAALGVGGKP